MFAQAELKENQSAEMLEKLELTEEWTKAGAAVIAGKACLIENGRTVEDDDEPEEKPAADKPAGDDSDEDDTVY